MRRVLLGTVISILMFGLAVQASAQSTTGTLVGDIVDASGARLPGVAVKVVNQQTGVSRDTITNELGSYRFNGLTPADYTITALGTWPLIALARAAKVIRPWPSAGRRARTRSFNSAIASASISSSIGRGHPVAVVTCHKLSKLSKLRLTVIARVSIPSGPASVHKP